VIQGWIASGIPWQLGYFRTVGDILGKKRNEANLQDRFSFCWLKDM
jgi:hypothetical protein